MITKLLTGKITKSHLSWTDDKHDNCKQIVEKSKRCFASKPRRWVVWAGGYASHLPRPWIRLGGLRDWKVSLRGQRFGVETCKEKTVFQLESQSLPLAHLFWMIFCVFFWNQAKSSSVEKPTARWAIACFFLFRALRRWHGRSDLHPGEE